MRHCIGTRALWWHFSLPTGSHSSSTSVGRCRDRYVEPEAGMPVCHAVSGQCMCPGPGVGGVRVPHWLAIIRARQHMILCVLQRTYET